MPSISRSPMEPPPAAKLAAQRTEPCVYPLLSWYQEPGTVGPSVSSSSSWVSCNQNRKRSKVDHCQIVELENDYDPEYMFVDGSPSDYKNKQPMNSDKILQNQAKVVHREIIELESDDDAGFVISDGIISDYKNKQPTSSGKILQNQAKVVDREIIEVDSDDDSGFVISNTSTSDYKNKQPMIFDQILQSKAKDEFSYKLVGSSTSHVFDGHVASTPTLESSNWANLNFSDGFNYGDYYFDDAYFGGFQFGAADNNYNLSLAPKFGNMGLPPGVEANMSWLQKFDPEISSLSQQKVMYEDGTDLQFKAFEQYHNCSLAPKFDNTVLPPGVEANLTWLPKHVPEVSSQSQSKLMDRDEINLKYKAFKQFDTVEGDSDHYFAKPEHAKRFKIIKKPPKDWTKRIQLEWKILEKDLPESIYVRVYEDRMDILRAAIIGPLGTPYHDGLFFFDVHFPPNYPNTPPLVHYHSGGLRLNPNLYESGKVCLSLLGTWGGYGCEQWNPSNSTMLQVLVSIQALVLNEKPYFNEPGYESWVNTPHGEKMSLQYNESTFILSSRMILYSLRKPPKHFEDFVAGHFLNHGRAILAACKAYLGGAQVGCLIGGDMKYVDERCESYSSAFKFQLRPLFDELLKEFIVLGVDCDEFVSRKLQGGSRAATAAAADTMLKL